MSRPSSKRGWTPSLPMTPPPSPLQWTLLLREGERGKRGSLQLQYIKLTGQHQQPGMFPPWAGNCPVKLSDLGNLGEFVRIPDLANLKQTEYLSTQNFTLSMAGIVQRKDWWTETGEMSHILIFRPPDLLVCFERGSRIKTYNHRAMNQFSEKIGLRQLPSWWPPGGIHTRWSGPYRTNNRGK